MKKLKIVLLTTKFDTQKKGASLVDDLVDSLVGMGHSVDVIFLDWAKNHTGPVTLRQDDLGIHVVPPSGGTGGVLSKVVRWVWSAFNVSKLVRQIVLPNSHDLLISFSPSIVFSLALLLLRSRIKSRVLIQWDFFPYHQAQIGLIPFFWMTPLAAWVETMLMNSFTAIGCMSPRNVDYLHAHFRVDRSVRVGVLPIWSKVRPRPIVNKGLLRGEFGIPSNAFVAVFGGQITAGRGIEDIVQMARIASKRLSKICFVVIGSGPKTEWLAAQSKEISDYLVVLPPVSRERYLDLVAACDAGLVMTVPYVDVPSFPSKTLDYCCAGLPVAAAVEKSTDFGQIITDAGFGKYCDAGDVFGLIEILEGFCSDPALLASMGKAARDQYEDYFSVDSVSISLLKMIEKD